MTYEEALELKAGEAVIFSGQWGAERPDEMTFIKLHYHPNGEVIAIVKDGIDRERWGYLNQIHLFEKRKLWAL
jgi:hypothetical protein